VKNALNHSLRIITSQENILLSGKYSPLRKIFSSQENIFLRGNYLAVRILT